MTTTGLIPLDLLRQFAALTPDPNAAIRDMRIIEANHVLALEGGSAQRRKSAEVDEEQPVHVIHLSFPIFEDQFPDPHSEDDATLLLGSRHRADIFYQLGCTTDESEPLYGVTCTVQWFGAAGIGSICKEIPTFLDDEEIQKRVQSLTDEIKDNFSVRPSHTHVIRNATYDEFKELFVAQQQGDDYLITRSNISMASLRYGESLGYDLKTIAWLFGYGDAAVNFSSTDAIEVFSSLPKI